MFVLWKQFSEVSGHVLVFGVQDYGTCSGGCTYYLTKGTHTQYSPPPPPPPYPRLKTEAYLKCCILQRKRIKRHTQSS